MQFTGERMIPASELCSPNTFWEHIYRYRFAARYARGMDVLDVACGEGYGSASLLAGGARSVVGVDVSQETVDHARDKYGVDARVGDAESLPVADKSFDLVVSFETIEHVQHPHVFIAECARVLKPGGLLIVSTPNSLVYGHDHGGPNPFHHSEMTPSEFSTVLRGRFSEITFWAQKPAKTKSMGLTGLRAEVSPFSNSVAFRKLRGLLRIATCPVIRGPVPTRFRQNPVAGVLHRDRPLSALVNPYELLRANEARLLESEYIIAAARF